MFTKKEFFSFLTLFKKYHSHIIVLGCIVTLSLISHFLPLLKKDKTAPSSLDLLVPKGFVLVPIDLSNGKDIEHLIGSYGVVDLYTHSEIKNIPKNQIASSIKIIPPATEETFYSALIPEKQVSHLFEYSPPFYAVIQNPKKEGSQIHKKKIKRFLTIIEEDISYDE